jgi:tetratricopeptide (TPR) repeat protein
MKDEAQARQTPPVQATVSASLRRRRLIGLAVLGLAAAVTLGLWLKWRNDRPIPPLPDLTDADPEVVELIHQSRNEVLRQRSAATAWGQFGKVLFAHEFNAEAGRCFQQAELLDPHDPSWPYLQGLLQVATDPVAAIACLQRAVQHDAVAPIPARLLLGELLLERGRLEEAQAQVDAVLRLEPDDVRARLSLVRLALLRQQWRSALEQLEGFENHPHARRLARTLRAEAWSRLGEKERAAQEQQQATALAPDQPWPDPFQEEIRSLQRGLRAYFRTVDSLLQAGRLDQAIQLLQQTLEDHPDSLEGWMRLGGIWTDRRINRPDRALECFQQAVRIDPEAGEAWFRLGCVQFTINPRDAAISFRESVRLRPNHAQAHFNLGQCLKSEGNRKGAREEFEAALRCRPDYERARTALSEMATPSPNEH